MDENFWHERWHKNEIGFHRSTVHYYLEGYFQKLNLSIGQKIFLPLCGKTLDIQWLLNQEIKVTGVELSRLAVEQLFEQLKITPNICKIDSFEKFESKNLEIYVGNFFNLTQQIIGSVNAIYDRAALVALPFNQRILYAKHLQSLTQKAKQLLITFDYDQSAFSGPPFSVPELEVKSLYSKYNEITLLESKNITGGIKGKYPAEELVWLLN